MKTDKTDKLFAIASDDWQNDIMSQNKYGSYKSNKRIVKKLNLVFGHKKIKEITRQDLQRYVSKLLEKASVDYVRHHVSVFKGVMEYADDNWVIPKIKIPKRKKPTQEFYSFEEARKLAEASESSLKVLVWFLSETGCRLGEALALTTKDINQDSISITKNIYEGVIQDTPKTESSVRNVCISRTLKRLLESIMLSDSKAFVFRSSSGRAAWPQQLTSSFKDTCDHIGLTWKGFHAFRRGNITELCTVLGLPERIVGYRVGHESTGMTLGVYCKTLPGCDRVWVEQIEKLLYKGQNESKLESKPD
jgi:integrase